MPPPTPRSRQPEPPFAGKSGHLACPDKLIQVLRPAPPSAGAAAAKPGLARPGDYPAQSRSASTEPNGIDLGLRYPRKIRLGWNGIFRHQRSGWAYALRSLQPLHAPNGVLFDDFVEKRFARGGHNGDGRNAAMPYREPWVGVVHNPPDVPEWFNINQQAPQSILRREQWLESLPSCRGLFTLSKYLRDWLSSRVPVPVENLLHPTGPPHLYFDSSRYKANQDKKLVQVGWWLRRFHSLYMVPTTRLRKILLQIGEPWVEPVLRAELDFVPDISQFNTVCQLAYLSNEQYDILLSQNLVFLDLYDSSANNALIECIVRGSPVIVNRLKAVVEYLGEDYPLYFENLTEAAQMAEDEDLVLSAHQCLMDNPLRKKLAGDYFLKSVAESDIYRAL